MKKLAVIVVSLFVTFFALTQVAGAAAYAPAVGGTGTTQKPNYGQILVGTAAKVYVPTATSSLGLPTFADIRFSTTSANYWSSFGLGFSTTSNDYWKTQNNFHSTTSANFWSSSGLGFSTSSADYWGGTKGYLTGNQTITLSGDVTGAGATSITTALAHTVSHWWTALQNFGNASTSQLTATSTVWLTSLATPAGTILAVDPNGRVIATTTSAGGVTSVGATYPLQSTGGATPVLSIAFGTTTTNIWSNLQTLTSGLISNSSSSISALSVINGTTTNATSTSLAVTGNASTTALVVSNTRSAALITSATGVVSAYAGSTCTNQFVRSLSALIAATCATVDLANDVTGLLATSRGGTGVDLSASTGVLVVNSGAVTASSTLAVLRGGTGSTTLTGLLKGNGTGGILTAVDGTDFTLIDVSTCSAGLAHVSVTAAGVFTCGNAFSTTSAAYFSSVGLAFSTTSSNYHASVGLGFSTTSAAYFLSQNTGNTFSTTSANVWSAAGLGFSTTSANTWATFGLGFSTTSANYWSSVGLGHSTTSVAYQLTQPVTRGRATSSGFAITSLTSCDTIDTDSSGNLKCGTDASGGGGGVWPFTTTDTNFGVAVQSTTTPEWFKNGMHASGTSYFVNASTTNISATNAYFTAINTMTSTGDLSIGAGDDISLVASAGSGFVSLSGGGETLTVGGGLTLFSPTAEYQFMEGSGNFAGKLNFSAMTADRTISFADVPGTVCIRNANCVSTSTANTWTAAQTFTGTLTFGNATGTNATTTSLSVGNLSQASCDVKSNGGVLYCGTDATGGSGGAWSWTLGTNFGVAVNSTSTPTHYTAGVHASSTSSFLDINAYGKVGIGSSTPWAWLSVVHNGSNPLFVIATSTTPTSMIFSVRATSTENGLNWSRISIGASNADGTGVPELWPFYLNAPSYSTYASLVCENVLVVSGITTDSTFATVCGNYGFDEDSAGATTAISNTSFTANGTPQLEMWAGLTAASTAVAASGDGAAIIQPNTGGAGLFSASSSPVFETYIQTSSVNASSTIYIVGFKQAGTGSDHAPTDATIATAAIYSFIATTTNWVAVSGNGGGTAAFTDTGIASTTGVPQRMMIVLLPTPTQTVASFYIDGVLVAKQTTSLTAIRARITPSVSVGARAAGLAKSMKVSWVRTWFKLIP
jgi:hypothetical protein